MLKQQCPVSVLPLNVWPYGQSCEYNYLTPVWLLLQLVEDGIYMPGSVLVICLPGPLREIAA